MLSLLVVLLAGPVAGAGCGAPRPADSTRADSVRAVVAHVAEHVITATYADLAREADRLHASAQALAARPTEAALDSTRAAWRRARVPWEAAEGFIFGPADLQNLDPALDLWPVNVVDVEAMLAAGPPGADELEGLDGTVRGFHTVEYLLWGLGGTKRASALTPPEREFLVALTERLARDAAALHRAWADRGGYADVFTGAGGADVYATPADALDELLMGVLFIASELADEKIEQPLASGEATFVESRFSGNSKADFQNNLRSVLHVYTGRYGSAAGPGLSFLIAPRDPALDARFRAEVEAAIAAIEAIPGRFRDALARDPEAVRAAQTAVRRVQQTIEEDLSPLLGR